MSRGHGRLQTAILDHVAREPVSIPLLALRYAHQQGVDNTPHLQASIRRAVARLEAEGLVRTWWVTLPMRWYTDGTPIWREMTVVTDPDYEELTDAMAEDVAAAHALFWGP